MRLSGKACPIPFSAPRRPHGDFSAVQQMRIRQSRNHGTDAYLTSPEIALAPVGYAAGVWSFGANPNGRALPFLCLTTARRLKEGPR